MSDEPNCLVDNNSISRQYVGKDVDCKVLQVPNDRVYPGGHEVSYQDDYLRMMNQKYDLNYVLGEQLPSIARGEWRPLAGIVMNSPLQNREGEQVLARMLKCSAEAEKWHPCIIDVSHFSSSSSIKTAKEYIERVNQVDPTSTGISLDAGLVFGIARAQEHNFAIPTEYDNKVIISPSQEFIDYVIQKRNLNDRREIRRKTIQRRNDWLSQRLYFYTH